MPREEVDIGAIQGFLDACADRGAKAAVILSAGFAEAGEDGAAAQRRISEIARDNLATVQEMSKATTNLAQQAENLAQMVSVFKVQ